MLIDDDRIAGVHEDSSSLSADGVDEVIDAHRHAVMPGLIDSHGHAGHALMKNVGVGRGKAWADACVHVYSRGSSADFWRAEARLASLERLKACVTTSVSLLGGGTDLIRNDTPDYALAYANAVGEAGTRAMGRGDELGSIEPGKRADIILVDLFKPHLVPINLPVARLAHFANAADVATVLVDGEVVMRDRQVMGVDEEAVLEDAETQCARVVRDNGLSELLVIPNGFWGTSRLEA